MKKNSQKPAMNVVLLQHQSHLLAGSIQSFSTNLNDDEDLTDDIGYGGGGSFGAR